MHECSTSDCWAEREVPQAEAEALEITELDSIFVRYLESFPPMDSLSKYIDKEQQARFRSVKVSSSIGDIVIRTAAGSTVEEAKLEISKMVGDDEGKLGMELFYSHP